MKKLLTILVVILLPFYMVGQQKTKKIPLTLAKYDDNVKLPLTAEEKAQIIEVYGDYAEKEIFNNENKLKNIKQILRNRVVVKLITNSNEKKACPKLSEVNLFNHYVPSLKRDTTFDPKTFNPLKYDFEFNSRHASMFQVDNTNYYIIIESQNQ